MEFGYWVCDAHAQSLLQKGNKMKAFKFSKTGVEEFPYDYTANSIATDEVPLTKEEKKALNYVMSPERLGRILEGGDPDKMSSVEMRDALRRLGIRNPELYFPSFPNRQPMTGEFVWHTDAGEDIKPRKMATAHIFYTLRMIWNHRCPPALRVGQFIRRGPIHRWPREYVAQAVHALRAELRRRRDVEQWMKDELADIGRNARFLRLVANAGRRIVCEPKESFLDYAIGDLDLAKRCEQAAATAVEPLLSPREDRRAKRKAKRMRRAVDTDKLGFPGKRCMEHRSYYGIRRPRVDCRACKQVFNARKARRRTAKDLH